MQWCVIFLTMCSRLDISIFCIFCNALAYTARMTRCNWHRCWIKVLCKIWWPRLRVSGVTSLPLSTHRCRPKCSSSRWAWTTRGTVRHWLPWKQCHRANQSTWPAAWRHQLCPAEASTSGQSPTRWPAAANQRAAVPRFDQSLTLTVMSHPGHILTRSRSPGKWCDQDVVRRLSLQCYSVTHSHFSLSHAEILVQRPGTPPYKGTVTFFKLITRRITF